MLALLFLFLAPLLYAAVPFVLIAVDPNSDFSVLALGYLTLGPFASAFWLMLVGVVPDAYRAHEDGRIFEANHFKGFGLMFVGFFAWLSAEALFLFYLFSIPRESSDIAVNAAQWRSWFAGMGIAAFLPVILLLGWRLIKWACAGRDRCRACHETVSAASLNKMGLCHYCYDDAVNEEDDDPEMQDWIRKVRYEFGDRQWASELRRGRKNALKWKRRIMLFVLIKADRIWGGINGNVRHLRGDHSEDRQRWQGHQQQCRCDVRHSRG
jgi:hypothetical protein